MNDNLPPIVPTDELKKPVGHSFKKISNKPLEGTKWAPLILFFLVFVLIIIFVGIFVWQYLLIQNNQVVQSTTSRPTAEQNREPESETARAQTEVLNTLNTSDELFMIEADIESTQIDTLDLEMQAIIAEIEGSVTVE